MRRGTVAASATGRVRSLFVLVIVFLAVLALPDLYGEARAVASAPERVPDHSPQVHSGHVLFRQLVRPLVRHPAVLQGLVEARHRLPVLHGLLLPVQHVREAVQERGDLLRDHSEDFLHFVRVRPVFLLAFLHGSPRFSIGCSSDLARPRTCDHFSTTDGAIENLRTLPVPSTKTTPFASRDSSFSRTIRREAVPRRAFTASVICEMFRSPFSNNDLTTSFEMGSRRPGTTISGETAPNFWYTSRTRKYDFAMPWNRSMYSNSCPYGFAIRSKAAE